jgi:2-aminomuconate deaminase
MMKPISSSVLPATKIKPALPHRQVPLPHFRCFGSASTASSALDQIVTFDAPKSSVGVSKNISSSKAPPPVGPYPHAKRVGEFLFLSGVGPRKPGTKDIPGVIVDASGEVVGHDVDVQTRAVLENIEAVLEEAGSKLQDVVDVQVYLTNMKRDFKKFNAVYGEYFGYEGGPSPTRTTVEVTALPTPICVELKVTAYVGSKKA